VAQRILVVDDHAEMRAVFRRALAAKGYEVSTAATLAEAWALDPTAYDGVLVDANLGAERGTDLIEGLRSQDATAPGRCLIITGGAMDRLPDDVARLGKPFQLDALIGAVRALLKPAGAATEPGQRPSVLAEPDRPLPVAGQPTPPEPTAAGPRLGPLLAIVRRLRARERSELADFLHDGPIQELTAASLELQLMRRSAPSSPQVDALQEQVDAASRALRELVDLPWRPGSGELSPTQLIRQRTAWLLTAPGSIDADAGLGAEEAPFIADIVELMLLVIGAACPAAEEAHVVVGSDPRLIQVAMSATSAPDDRAVDGPVLLQAALNGLASALGAELSTDFTGPRWRACLAVRGRSA
jgi:CheY-like chemotaxis protein